MIMFEIYPSIILLLIWAWY